MGSGYHLADEILVSEIYVALGERMWLDRQSASLVWARSIPSTA